MDSNHTAPGKESAAEPPPSRPLGRFQFGLDRLMGVTLAVAVFLAVLRWWGMAGFVTLMFLAVPLCLSRRGVPADLLLLKSAAIYCFVSVLTLPLWKEWWLGELPPLAIFQLPKVEFAKWLCERMVMSVMGPLGLSRGSYSPDYIAARPYALAIAYLVPLVVLLAIVWLRRRRVAPYLRWTCVLLVAAVVDFVFTLVFVGGPGPTLY